MQTASGARTRHAGDNESTFGDVLLKHPFRLDLAWKSAKTTAMLKGGCCPMKAGCFDPLNLPPSYSFP